MDRLATLILLERQYTWPLRVIRVVFDHNTGGNAPDYISR
jgi:hypothetical protein